MQLREALPGSPRQSRHPSCASCGTPAMTVRSPLPRPPRALPSPRQRALCLFHCGLQCPGQRMTREPLGGSLSVRDVCPRESAERVPGAGTPRATSPALPHSRAASLALSEGTHPLHISARVFLLLHTKHLEAKVCLNFPPFCCACCLPLGLRTEPHIPLYPW